MMRLMLFIPAILLLTECDGQRENPEITVDELKGHLSFLASDSLKGRLPGTPEDYVAARFIADQFRKAGLKWLTEGGLQPFEVTTDLELGQNNTVSFNDFTGTVQEDFAPFPFSSNNQIKAEVIFLGYGFDIDEKELIWNDYQSVDATNAWVMVLRGNPEIDSTESVFHAYSDDRDKTMVAKDRGAPGILLVSGEIFDPDDELTPLRKGIASSGIPAIHIKRSIADRILKASGTDIRSLEQKINSERKPIQIKTGVILDGTTEVNPTIKTTYNIIGYLEGSNPALKDPVIALGAHYDHLGFGGPGSSSREPDTIAIHYGADDNASGISALIEIAEKLSASVEELQCSYLFIAFGAEEMGLLGSKYFINHPVIPLEKIRLMTNLDMIGRMKNNYLQVGGTGTSLESESIVRMKADSGSINLAISSEGYGPSDHASFYAKDIPVLFITTGPHTDYHTHHDQIEKINFEGMITISEYVYDVLTHIDDLDSSLTFREAGPKAPSAGRYGRMKVTLGIMPDFATSDEYEGMRVDLVIPGKPASQGGMKAGDIIISIEGKTIDNIYDYMYRMSKFDSGQQIIVTVKREGVAIDLLMQL